MNTRLRSYLLLPSCCSALLAGAQLTQGCFTLDAFNAEEGKEVAQLSDGGYAVVGIEYAGNDVNFVVFKTHADGSYQWTVRIDVLGVDDAYSVAATADGGCVVAGHSGVAQDQDDMVLVKLNASGGLVWAKKSGTLDRSEFATKVAVTSDGGYVLAGTREDAFNGIVHPYVVKLDAAGDQEWASELDLGPTALTAIYSVTQTPDSGIVGAGYIVGLTNHAYVFKLDPDGELLWSRKNLEEQNGGFFAVTNTNDSNLVLAGGSIATGLSNIDPCIVKIDQLGELIWARVVLASPATEYMYGVTATADSGFVASGTLDEFGADPRQYLVKVDKDGGLLWTRVIGTSYQLTNGITALSNGGLATVGTIPTNMVLTLTDAEGMPCALCGVDSIGEPSGTITLSDVAATVSHVGSTVPVTVTLTSVGSITPICTSTGVADETLSQEVILAPQPMTEQLEVRIPGPWLQGGPVTFAVLDLLGRIVLSMPVRTSSFTVDRHTLASGLHTYRMSSGTRTVGGKLLVE